MSDEISVQVQAHLAGDRDASARLAARAGRIAMPFAAATLGGRDRAADVVQDVVVDVLRGAGSLRDPSAFDGWVRRIATRHVLRDLRRGRLRRSREEPLDAHEHAGDGGGHDDLLTRIDVGAALRTLPPRQRVALALRYVHDLTDDEIASVLGCRPGTAASLCSRGRETLRHHPALRPVADPTAPQEATL